MFILNIASLSKTSKGVKRNALTVLVTIAAIIISLAFGFAVSKSPMVLGLVPFTVVGLYLLINHFQKTVLGLLILRSSLDAFSKLQVPAAFAVGMIGLAIGYVAFCLLTKKEFKTDSFWWFLLAWIFCQGIWVVLLPLGGLGRGAGQLGHALEQWLRLFSWSMVYLLIMQLKDHMHPKTLINWLFLSLVIPIFAALLQILLPPSVLPPFLVFSATAIEAGSRINGTMGHPNSLASFLVLFVGLSLWKLEDTKKYLMWAVITGFLVFVLTSTKSLGGLVIIAVFTVAYLIPRLNFPNLIGTTILLSLVFVLFSSSDFGRERLSSLYETPLLNPDLDHSRTLLLAWGDGNSLNWRIAQWTYLLDSWRDFPIMGYGLATTKSVSVFHNHAHNDYIGALVEGGIVGLFAFVAFLVGQFVRIIHIVTRQNPSATDSQRSLCIILLSLLCAMCVGMIAANVIIQTTFFYYWFTLLAVSGWDWSEPDLLSGYSDYKARFS